MQLMIHAIHWMSLLRAVGPNDGSKLETAFFAAQEVVEGMKISGGGSIINFSSISYMMGMKDIQRMQLPSLLLRV